MSTTWRAELQFKRLPMMFRRFNSEQRHVDVVAGVHVGVVVDANSTRISCLLRLTIFKNHFGLHQKSCSGAGDVRLAALT